MAMLLYILWVSSVGLGFAQTPAPCPSGWFGNGCVYKCRCTTSCESDGSCSPGNRCQLGWFGPACQYLDLAQNISATLSVYPNNVTDGDDTTCNTDNTLQTLTLSWAPSSYTITWLRLTARNIDSLNTVTVQFSKDGGNTFLNVTCVKSPNIDSKTKDVFCDLNTPVNLVKLAGEGVKSLCSVYVSGGRNVALKQSTVQSGNYSDIGIIYWSGLAVDGNNNQDFKQGNSCTATGPNIKPAYWSISLSHPVTVSRYVLYNRIDGSDHRLKGFQLTSFDVKKAQVYGYNDTAPAPLFVYKVVPDPTVSGISSVKVTANSSVDLLTICEFEMYGDTDCDAGRYGRECEHTCNCAVQREPCFVSTGGCPSGCAAGYMGEACTEHCDSGWFGLGCRFKCHCSDNTCQSVDGQCNTCKNGWFGPACQYVDMMQTSNELQQSPVREISDVNDTTCMMIYNNQPVTVTWNSTFYFTWLRVAVQDSNSLNSLTVTFNDTSNPVPCTNQRRATVTDQIVDIHCDLSGPVNKVTLTGPRVSSLCSVYISGGRNVALRQPTSQSSTYSENGVNFGPEKAVDGNTSGDFNNVKSCTATQGSSSSNWDVTFLHPVRVFSYVIYNRVGPDNIGKRLRGFKLTSFDPDDGLVYSYIDNGTTIQDIYTVLPTTPLSSISRVNIRVGTDSEYILTLCEVEVYGETVCEPERFGRECENSCNCTNTHETCFVSTGGCPGCRAGYTGITCTESCSQGTYGEDCKFNCSSQCANHTDNTPICDNVNGTCDNGCHDGYARPLCDEACPQGTYGKDCTLNCSSQCANHTNNTSICDNVNGTCEGGCRDGYKRPLCRESCPPGNYGKDCDSSCSENCIRENNDTSFCDPVNGTCKKGCLNGYIGPLCNTSCYNGTYGEMCKFNCSQYCAVHDNNHAPLCNNVNGSCQGGCLEGYTPPLCNESCPPGFYGKHCTFSCSQNCMNRTINDGPLCDHVNGTCDGGCRDGFITSLCNQSCTTGKYGRDCSFSCSEHCLDHDGNGIPKCQNVDGVCQGGCDYGYYTDLCNLTCKPGKYGKDCSSSCSENCLQHNNGSSLCDHVNGTCDGGCHDGYITPLCERMIQGEEPTPAGPIVGAVIGVLAAVALIAFGVIFWRRRRKSKPNQQYEEDSNEGRRNILNKGMNGSTSDVDYVELKGGKKELPIKTANKVSKLTAGAKSEVYYNTLPQPSSTSIPLKDLDTFLATHNKSFFQEQFSTIPINNEATTDVAERPENKVKNRFKNIYAYDHSRVHLTGNDKDDYINASHIQGYKGEEKFIASQGPTKRTVEDFVRMLWEQDVEKVVMLTNLIENAKEKCERYWPEDADIKIGEITVRLTTTEVFADYTIRKLQLRKAGDADHLVTHFHFTSWPDLDVPLTPWGLVDFEQRVTSIPTNKPIVVHCSAGVGRTGTFIALRNVMKQAEDTGCLDVFTTVQKLRHDRINMVQTARQFQFLHRAAQVGMLCMGTTVISSEIQSRISTLEKVTDSGQTSMENEFMTICTLSKNDEADLNEMGSADDSSNVYENHQPDMNRHKNRHNNIIPKPLYRPDLQCETDYLGEYINAVFVPSFRKQNQQFLTQVPLPTTITDFWRLVTQYDVSLIVAFQDDFGSEDPTIGEYLPPADKKTVAFSLFEVESQTVSTDKLWKQTKLTLTADTEYKNSKISKSAALKEEIVLTHLKCLSTDLNPENFLALVSKVRSLSPRGESRTVYMCRNGADFSGLVCTLSLLLDRMDNDGCLTVPLVVGAMKAVRPQVIPSLAQYKVLYEVLRLYSETSNVYANIGNPD